MQQFVDHISLTRYVIQCFFFNVCIDVALQKHTQGSLFVCVCLCVRVCACVCACASAEKRLGSTLLKAYS